MLTATTEDADGEEATARFLARAKRTDLPLRIEYLPNDRNPLMVAPLEQSGHQAGTTF
jgi:hypothetical protein